MRSFRAESHSASIRNNRRSVAWTKAPRHWIAGLAAGLLAIGLSAAVPVSGAAAAAAQTHTYVVGGAGSASIASAVGGVGGSVTETLPRVGLVVAELSGSASAALSSEGFQLNEDTSVQVQDVAAAPAHAPSAVFPEVTQANGLWAHGITGSGVSVAVLDTGIDRALPDLAGRVIDGVDLSGENNPYQDSYGHGTFVAGIIASNGASSNQTDVGEAPGANLVAIKVAGANGITSESTVITGINWAITNAQADNIRVLNISLGVKPPGPSQGDLLDQAVEAAWNAGIVVVTSAGNYGPDNGTITSPGNDPLVISVGALDDGGGTNPANFSVPAFSSVGPTLYNGWFKPDVIAPGRSVIGLEAPGSTVALANPQSVIGTDNFVGSGTSFSAAVVSGAAALMLQAHPEASPDTIKSRLLWTANPGPVGNPLVDGHGVVNVYGATAANNVPELRQSPTRIAQLSNPPATVPLGFAWAVSSWNRANWNGAAWNGAAWNGAAWNGAAWNGAAWNGAAWNGAAWNGAAWNGDFYS